MTNPYHSKRTIKQINIRSNDKTLFNSNFYLFLQKFFEISHHPLAFSLRMTKVFDE
jgi:hypothetical protein